MNIILKEKLKFLLTGTLNTLFTYLIYIFLLNISFHYQFAFIISWLLGLIFTFYLNIKFVFVYLYKGKKKKMFIKFFILSLIQLVFSLLLLDFLIQNLDFNKKVAPLIILFLFYIFKFLVSKFYIFSP
jgi:putative flippase GtrA